MQRRLFSSVSLLVLAGTLLVVLPSLVQAATIHVEAFIDGRSQLILRGNTAQWQHFDADAPGLWDGNNYPTEINNRNWVPLWTGNTNNCDGCYSNVFNGVCPGLAAAEQTVALNVIYARVGGNVTIVEQPSSGNNYSLVVEFNDNSPVGAEWYVIELDFAEATACSAVPTMNEWGIIIFVILAGIGAVFYLRKQRRAEL